MDHNFYTPRPSNLQIHRPIKVSDKGNLYKVQINHFTPGTEKAHNFEVWTTHEAVQKHFQDIGMSGMPEAYQVQKFARHIYDQQLRKNNGIPMQHKGVFISTTQQTHGDPHLWPHTLNDTEIKY